MPSCTFYRPDGLAANGASYRQNAARYGAFCAGNRWPLGTRLLLTSRAGRRVRVTVVDRIGYGSDVDCSVEAARALMGRRYAIIGRLSVRVRVLSRPRVRRHHR